MNNNFANLFSLDGALRALGYIRNRRGTWANRPSTPPNYTPYYATDIGEKGTQLIYFGSRWYVQNGSGSLKTLGAAVTGIANTETIVLQALIPAGAWQTNETVRIWIAASKSGTVDSAYITVRVGTAGTTGDTAILTLSAAQMMGSTGVSGGGIYDIKLIGATTALRVGAAGNSLATYGTMSATSTAATSTTIADASANALYVSVGVASAGASNTLSIQSAQIQLITP